MARSLPPASFFMLARAPPSNVWRPCSWWFFWLRPSVYLSYDRPPTKLSANALIPERGADRKFCLRGFCRWFPAIPIDFSMILIDFPWLSMIFLDLHQSSSIIMNRHHQSSSSIIIHHQSSSIIINHHQLSFKGSGCLKVRVSMFVFLLTSWMA